MADEKSENGFRLLIAIKGVARDDKAFQQGILIAKALDTSPTLIKVISKENQRSQAEKDLDRVAETLAPLHAERLIRLGNPPEAIIREAAHGAYDLVVIGEKILNPLFEPLLTHTVERVLREMPCPVLVAKPGSRPLRRFLMCEGGRSTVLLPAVTGRLAPLMRTAEKIAVLHVMSQITARPGVKGWELRADAEELIGQHTPEGARLEYDLDVLDQLRVDLVVKVRHGVVVEEILDEARLGDYDVIVLGHPGLRGWQRFLVDEPVQKIIQQSRRPVLVI